MAPNELSLRDYFAAQALVGLLAGEHKVNFGEIRKHEMKTESEFYAVLAYKLADAMVAVSKK